MDHLLFNSAVIEWGGITNGPGQGLMASWPTPLRSGRKSPYIASLRGSRERETKCPMEFMVAMEVLRVRKEGNGGR